MAENIFYRLGDFFGNFGGKRAQKAYFNQRIPYQINKGSVYINAIVPYKIYNSIPQFKTPVDKLAAMFANGKFALQQIGGEDLLPLPPDIAALLENPNVFQGQNPFMKTYLRQLLIYGNQFIYKNHASKLSAPASLTCVSSAYIKPVLTGSVFDQVSMDGIVKEYNFIENGNERTFETKDVLWSKIDDIDNPVLGISPLFGLQFPTSNTELAYKYLNCISGEMGALGFISATQNKDSMGPLPTNPKDIKELETQYRNDFGVEDDQMKIKFTSAPLTFTHTSHPTGELLLLEQIDANFLTILHQLGVNPNLFINSTYENLRHGLVMTHNDTIVPYADGFTQSLSKFIGIKPGYRLVLDYSHLPYLQLDKVSEATTFASVSSALASLVSGAIITPAEAKIRLEAQFGK